MLIYTKKKCKYEKEASRKTLYFRLKTDLRKSIFEEVAGYYLKWPYALFCDIIIL